MPSKANDFEVAIIVVFVLGLCLRRFVAKNLQDGLLAISTTLFGLMYVPWLLNFIAKIVFLPGIEGRSSQEVSDEGIVDRQTRPSRVDAVPSSTQDEHQMNHLINAKDLRARLPEVVAKVRRGARYTVLYRSRPAFQVIPVDSDAVPIQAKLEEDSLYRAKPVGRSRDGRSAADHDAVLYGR